MDFDPRSPAIGPGPGVSTRVPHAVAVQFASGVVGAGLAFALACPALGAASIGTLADGSRVAERTSDASWRWAYLVGTLAAAGSVYYAITAPQPISGWVLIAFAAAGALANLASMLMAFPARLSSGAGEGLSGACQAVLGVIGVVLLLKPAGWVCLAGTAIIGLILGGRSLVGATRRQ